MSVDGIQTGWDKDKQQIKLQEGQKEEIKEAQAGDGQKRKKKKTEMWGGRRDIVREKWNWSWKDLKCTASKSIPVDPGKDLILYLQYEKTHSNSKSVRSSLCNGPFCIMSKNHMLLFWRPGYILRSSDF